MKTKIYSLLIAVGLLSSCNNFLDVDMKGKVVPKTVEDYDEMLNDPIRFLVQNPNYMIPELDLTAEEIPGLASKDIKAYRWDAYQYLSGENDDDYSGLYSRIYAANEIINHIDEAESVMGNEKLRMEVKGQAHADRACYYWTLVNLYGYPYSKVNEDKLGVSLILENDLAQKSKRATVGEVYAQICQDLWVAAALAPEKVAPLKKLRASRQAVYAFQAKVWLYMNQIDSAEVAIGKALETEPVLYDYNSFVNQSELDKPQRPCAENGTRPRLNAEKNDEIIWYSPIYYYSFAMNPATVSQNLVDLFNPDEDLRYILEYGNVDPFTGITYERVRYFASSGVRTYLICSAEMYLLKAEILARKGDYANAMIALNALREKRYLTGSDYSLSATDAADALKKVKEERAREWACTFMTWFDLRRYQAYGETIPTFQRQVGDQTYTLAPGSNLYTLSIAPYVIEKNPNIEQNPR